MLIKWVRFKQPVSRTYNIPKMSFTQEIPKTRRKIRYCKWKRERDIVFLEVFNMFHIFYDRDLILFCATR